MELTDSKDFDSIPLLQTEQSAITIPSMVPPVGEVTEFGAQTMRGDCDNSNVNTFVSNAV